MTDDAKKIAELVKAEVEAALKSREPKPQPSREDEERATAKWINEMHQLRERNASRIPGWMREACAGGVTDADCADIVHASHRPTGRPGMIPEKQVSEVRSANVPGSGTGWQAERPLGPQPGIYHVDAQAIADAERQRGELKRKLGE
jgi:hypothetical protein